MPKTEVYSWRLSPTLKAALEQAARNEEKSLAELLELIARRYLEHAGASVPEDERRARAAARRAIGSLQSGRPDMAERASELVKERLKKKRRAS